MQRAVGDGRNPIALQARLAVRIHHGDLRTVLFRVVEIFRGDRLVVRHVGAEQHDQIGMQPVGVAARRGTVPKRRFHRRG